MHTTFTRSRGGIQGSGIQRMSELNAYYRIYNSLSLRIPLLFRILGLEARGAARAVVG